MTSRDDYVRSLDTLRQRQGEMTERLVSWVGINSYSRNLPGLEAMAAELAAAFSELPGTVELVDLEPAPEYTSRGEDVRMATGRALRLTCRPDAPFRVLLSGHYDTVHPPESPFREATIRGGRLYGPGAMDMKGGLIVMLEALRHVETHAGADTLGWEVVIVPDEEVGSRSSAPLYDALADSVQAALVFEPVMPDGRFSRARKGSGTFNAVAEGRAAHVGRAFGEGRNAIAGLADFVARVHALNGQVPGAVFNVGRIDGGGALNVVPDRAAAQFNFRVTEPADIPAIEARIAAIRAETEAATGCAILWEGAFTRPPKPWTPALEAMFTQVRGLGAEMGLALDWTDTGGCSDGNNLAAAGLPNLDTLGVAGDGIHSREEFAELDSLPQRAALAAMLLYEWAAGRIPPELAPAS